MELVSSAILIGILLSLVLIGPVFFMVLETSISNGWKSAIVLDLGVISSDLMCILIAYYGSKELAEAIQNSPSIYIFGGFFIFIYGLMMYIKRPDIKARNMKAVSKNYLKTYFNGFILNTLNVGVLVFWFFVVGTIVIQYGKKDTMVFMGIVLGTFFCLDLLKIMLAQRLKEKFTFRRVFYFKKIIGLILMIFGIIVILKGFGVFDEIDQEIENRIQKGVHKDKITTLNPDVFIVSDGIFKC